MKRLFQNNAHAARSSFQTGKLRRRKFLEIFALLPVILITSLAGGAEVPKLSAKQYASLVTEADQTVYKHLHAQPPAQDRVNVPKKYWGETMLALKPLKVVMDGVNLKIVFQDDREEAGFYLCPVISSTIPQARDFRELVVVSAGKEIPVGTLYRYRRAQE
ncbi:MAG TPA: hypothetical protein VGO11_01875 [Chthoniobacteraceae bacterium]|jgi:hypothetical protein|nr:hypothetical protein [Chthoniobacteraceae bacterium]